jgi:hypothetical protein
MYDPEELKDHFKTAGFKKVAVENIRFTSGSTSIDNVVEAFLLKHRLGREVATKDPALLEPLSKRMKHAIAEQFGENDRTFELSAFLATGTK